MTGSEKEKEEQYQLLQVAFSQGSLQLSQAMTNMEGRIQCLGVYGHCESPQLNYALLPWHWEAPSKEGRKLGSLTLLLSLGSCLEEQD